MPCPYFEPQQIARYGQEIRGRLPLFDEYRGRCHCCYQTEQTISPTVRFFGCNQGHPDSGCTLLPPGENRRNRRFHLRRATEGTAPMLEVLILDIQDGIPVRSHSVLYSKADKRLEPEVHDPCERAQVLAFCHGYLERFSSR